MTTEVASARWLTDPNGSGPLLAFVHGLEDGWESWLPLVSRLDPEYRCVALDMPWRAGNAYDWLASGTPADWVCAGLSEIDERVDVVVGHSFGSNALLEYLATELRASVAGIGAAVLTAPFFRPPDLPVTWKVFDRSRRQFHAQIREGVRSKLGVRVDKIHPDVLEAMLAKTLDRIGMLGFLTVFRQYVSSADLPLADVCVPTLVVAGADDPSLGSRAVVALSDAMPRARVHIEEGCDHFFHVRQPEALAALVADVVATALARRREPSESAAS